MTINPAEHDHSDIYRLMVGIIVPRPIGFVSTVSRKGVLNLAPFSYFTAASANPPVVLFCPLIRSIDSQKKDTLRNVEATGEFVINIVSEDFAREMNRCSPEFPPEVDEFAVSGLTPLASDLVRPPRVQESRVHMECRLQQVVEISAKPLGGSIVIGEVLRFHVADELLDGFKVDPDRLRAIGRMGGPAYARTADRFEMRRPTARD